MVNQKKQIRTRIRVLAVALYTAVTIVSAQSAGLFSPYRSSALRLPSVPIVVNDPYFSVWSPYDRLTDGPTAHWTGASKPLTGVLRVDGTPYRFMGGAPETGASVETAEQRSVSVMATSTYYTFSCGAVDLDVVFTSPMLIDSLELLSTPVSYVSYRVRSRDGKPHGVQFSLSASPLLAMNRSDQPVVSVRETQGGLTYLKTGTVDQPVLAKKGDGICIDWGYFYLPAVNGRVSLQSQKDFSAFLLSGRLEAGPQRLVTRDSVSLPLLTYVHDFGSVVRDSSFALVGYDEVEDIEYMYTRYKGYWARHGKTLLQAFGELAGNYAEVMSRCRAWDRRIYDDGFRSGGREYAEMLSGSYRHVMAAHKLFEDHSGHLLFFSKENNSNGCVNTVDLTYPEAPLFLCYNPVLEKAMMTSIFEYSRSGRWTKPFPAHDLGTYPIADGQVYGGDMPVEEAGNMLILSAMLSRLDGNVHWVEPYWHWLTEWADYLVQNGRDPENQLCTDDFAGHWAHNCNLSVKAVMGIAGYAEMAALRGDSATAGKYLERAREMADWWTLHAADGDHTRLAFDRPGTWSQKYNMVWDRLWGTRLFPAKTVRRELSFYLRQQNRYGLPLDCRKTYTKSDWILWTAAMSPDVKTFQKFLLPVYRYIDETPSRVPISDWHETVDGRMVAFKARSVIGGYWMKVLADRLANEPTGRKTGK